MTHFQDGTVPRNTPCFRGENVTLIVHAAPAASPLRQVDVTANPLLAFIDATRSPVEPVFVRTTSCGMLVLPTACVK